MHRSICLQLCIHFRRTCFSSCVDLRCFDVEKEKQDVSSPRGVLEACIRGFESDAGSSKNISNEMDTRSNSSWSRFFKLWKKRSFKRLGSLPPLGVSKGKSSTRENPELSNLSNFKSSLVNFSLSELQTATNNFNPGLYYNSKMLAYFFQFYSRLYLNLNCKI